MSHLTLMILAAVAVVVAAAGLAGFAAGYGWIAGQRAAQPRNTACDVPGKEW